MKYSFTKEHLKDLYWKQRKSQQEIAKIFGRTQTTISRLMIKYNIKRRPCSPSNPLINLSQKEIEILQGELLGDGCLRIAKRGKNASFQHSAKYKEYEIYLFNVLSFLNDREIWPDDNGNYHIYSLTSPTLTKIYNQWYHNGIKIVWPNIRITPIILQHWHMGDGVYKLIKDIVKIKLLALDYVQILSLKKNKKIFYFRN